MWLCRLTLKIWHEIGADKFVFIFCENKEPNDLSFQNKHLSTLCPKITPTSEPQIISLSGCCYKAPKSNGIPGKRINAIAYSKIWLCLNHFSLHIYTTENKLNFANRTAPVIPLLSFAVTNSARQTGALLSALPSVSMLASTIFHIKNLNRLKLTKTERDACCTAALITHLTCVTRSTSWNSVSFLRGTCSWHQTQYGPSHQQLSV